MDVTERRMRAKTEFLELGPTPSKQRPRRVATDDWVSTEVRDLLLAAANECSGMRSHESAAAVTSARDRRVDDPTTSLGGRGNGGLYAGEPAGI